jgi:hypothetical protein
MYTNWDRYTSELVRTLGKKKTPYWSANLVKLRKVARRAWNHRASYPNAYSIAVSEYSKALRKEERAAYKHMTSIIEGKKPAVRLHKRLSQDDTYRIRKWRIYSYKKPLSRVQVYSSRYRSGVKEQFHVNRSFLSKGAHRTN